MKADYVNSIE